MRHNDMESIARCHPALGVKQIAGGAHSLHKAYAYLPLGEQAERERRIHQSHINATFVGRGGHYVFVTGFAQETAACHVVHDAVVLHLAQSHKVGQLPRVSGSIAALLLPARYYGLTHTVQFPPVTGGCPVVGPVGKKLGIVLQRVVPTVEKVLTIQFHERED